MIGGFVRFENLAALHVAAASSHSVSVNKCKHCVNIRTAARHPPKYAGVCTVSPSSHSHLPTLLAPPLSAHPEGEKKITLK